VKANKTQMAKRSPQKGYNSKGGRLAFLAEEHSTGCYLPNKGDVTALHATTTACSGHEVGEETGSMVKIRGSTLATEREG
jgi:hypothetical protein